MSGKHASDQSPARRWRLGAIAAAILFGVLAGYVLIERLGARREAAKTLARLPERPVLDASTRALAPALDRAIAAVERSPGSAEVGALGQLYQANYFFDEAAACYERAMELDPDEAEWPYLLSYVESMKGGSRARDLLDRAIALAPDYVPGLLRRADDRYKSGDRQGARADYEKCLELEPNNVYAHLGLGRIAMDEEDWRAAEGRLSDAVGADAALGTAYSLLASVYGKLGMEEERERARVQADTQRRFVASPDPWVDRLDSLCYHTEQLLTKGNRAEKIGQLAEAEAYFKRVLALEPGNFFANAELGNLLQRQHRFSEAATHLEIAVATPSRGDLVRHKDLNYNLGNNYYWQNKPALALPFYQKALELDSGMVAAYHGLAGCHLKLGDADAAILACQGALSLDPESAEAHFNWGQALLLKDDLASAISRYAEARRLDPNMPPPEFRAGTYYVSKGDPARAEPYLRRALEIARDEGNLELAGRLEAFIARSIPGGGLKD